MRNIFVKTSAGIALSLVALTMFMPEQKALSAKEGGGRLEGTWEVVLTARNCSNGDVITSFPEVATFMSGGTMIDSTAGLAQSLKTPAQGVWSHETGDVYHFSAKSFSFNSAGAFTGWTIVAQDLTLNSEANEYTSAGTADGYDTSGNHIFHRCSTTIATRFE